MALAHHKLGHLEKARELYRKSEKTYQIAYSRINPDEVTIDGVEMKQRYLKTLKEILEYHLLAAEQSGAEGEAEDVRKLLGSLP